MSLTVLFLAPDSAVPYIRDLPFQPSVLNFKWGLLVLPLQVRAWFGYRARAEKIIH